MAILSFNGNKIITTSGGGALITRSEDLKNRTVHLATQAREPAPHYQHATIGYNYRMSNVLAGIGRGQMKVLRDHVAARRRNYDTYRSRLAHRDDIQFVPEPEGATSNRWLTTILTDSYAKREAIRLRLESLNIESRPLWKPMHMQPVFSKCPQYVNGVSEDLFQRGLCLPSGSSLTDADLARIIQGLTI